MHMLLLFVGLLGTAAGGVLLASVYADPEMRFAGALITSGVIAVAAGLVLIGLGAVLSRLRRISEALEMQPLVSALPPAIQSQAHDAVAAAIGLGALGAEPRLEPVAEKAQPDEAKRTAPIVPPPVVAPEPAAELAAASATEWPRVDASDRVAPPITEGELQVSEPSVSGDKPDERRESAVQKHSSTEDQAKTGKHDPARTVLKSGVIEGMAYTLYSDGSVDAELPEGTMHFTSIAEWRAHMRAEA